MTPSVMPSPTLTYMPDDMGMPVIVTVIQTELVEAPISTVTPVQVAEVKNTPVQSVVEGERGKKIGAPWIIFGALVIFIAGIGAEMFWSKRTGK